MPQPLAALDLPVVDARTLPKRLRTALRPGAAFEDGDGVPRRLPRFFYRVESWAQARETMLAPNFCLYEFMHVDLHEAPEVRRWPRYVPCAVTVLAAHLSVLRLSLGTYVHVEANGAYRSPAHARTTGADTEHAWATCVRLYRIGDDRLDTQETIEKYRRIVRETLPAVRVRPYGPGEAESDDHLHLSLGAFEVVPPGKETGKGR